MRYKVGDKIVIKKEIYKTFRPEVIERLDTYKKKYFVVEKIIDFRNHSKLKIKGMIWYWEEDWFNYYVVPIPISSRFDILDIR